MCDGPSIWAMTTASASIWPPMKSRSGWNPASRWFRQLLSPRILRVSPSWFPGKSSAPRYWPSSVHSILARSMDSSHISASGCSPLRPWRWRRRACARGAGWAESARPPRKSTERISMPDQRHRVVIIGSGFGGLTAAKALKRADVDVTLISKTTSHLFQPLLYQVATGILSEGEIAPTTRLVLRKQKNVRVLLGDVEAIDLQANTVTSRLMTMRTVTRFDSLIVAAGAQQSYFGNDHFATYAPGMKTIDDALELRGRILGAFEAAEVATDHAERERRLTFVVIGAGPTGVELAGQIAELAERTLAGAFRTIDPSECRVILLDAAPAVMPAMGDKLGGKAQRRLEKIGVEIKLNAMVTA